MNLDKIESAAKAATPGPWRVDEDGVYTRIDGRYRIILSANITDDRRTSDANHIANMDPQAALKLVAIARAAMKARTALSELLMTRDPVVYADALRALDDALDGVE